MGLGLYPDVQVALRQSVRLSAHYEPDAGRHQRYNDLYPLFRSIYDHLRGDFDLLAALNPRQ